MENEPKRNKRSYQLDSVKTFKYVTEQNAYIYRPIVRHLYNKHMSFEHYNTTIKDIYDMLVENEVAEAAFLDENLQSIVNRLEEWEVIKSRQEKQNGMTIEEFKRKSYLYQVTDLGAEIEALLIRIDELDEQLMGSLDSKQFSILLKYLETFRDIDPSYMSFDEVSTIWSTVFDTHKKLRTNASTYLYHIQEAERSNLFNSALFLEFKDVFMQYLGTYITELDRIKHKILNVLKTIQEDHVEKYIYVLVEGNKPNSILYENFSEGKFRISLQNKWIELRNWFLGVNNGTSDIDVLSNKTMEAIRMILKYANSLSDASINTGDRVANYRELAKRFIETSSLGESHRLYGAAFGATHSRSLYASHPISLQETGEYTNGDEIWQTDIPPFKTPNMGNRGPRGKTQASSIKNNRLEKQRKMMEKLERKKEDERSIEELVQNGKIVLADIKEPLQPFQRKVILKWLMRTSKMRLGTSNKKSFSTETGMVLSVRYRSKDIIVIPSTDGNLRGHDIEFIVERRNEE